MEIRLNCRRVILHFWKFFIPHSILIRPPPILAKCGDHKNFHCHFYSVLYEVISPSSTSQPLSDGVLSTTSSNLHLTPSGEILNSSTFFRVAAIFPIGHFITTPPLYEHLYKISTLYNYAQNSRFTNEKFDLPCFLVDIFTIFS